jgi:aspartokinase-like uncharacterized kinase
MPKTEIAYFIFAFFIGLFVPWWVVPLKDPQHINASVVLLSISLLAMLGVVKKSWNSVVIALVMFTAYAVAADLIVYAFDLRGVFDPKTILAAIVWAVLGYAGAMLARRYMP